MADVLDVARIEKELQEINQQRSQTRERLDALRGGGRGRGRGGDGPGGRHGVFSRLGDSGMHGGPGPQRDAPGGSGSRPSVFDRLYSQGSRPSGPQTGDRTGREAGGGELHRTSSAQEDAANGRPLSRRLSSRISSAVVAPADAGREEGDDPDHHNHNNSSEGIGAAGRKRLLSAVMVNGQARQLSGSLGDRGAAAASAEERPAKRPALAADARTKQRAARMFGTLVIGTLQKFQNEDKAFKETGTAQRRAEMTKRAQERADAETERLRTEAATAWRQEREDKLNTLHDLNLQAEIKALQLRYAKRIQLRQQLTGFCVTATQPPLYWQPKQSSKETAPLLEKAEASFAAWKQQQLQELEAERTELTQAAAAKREAALARLAAREPPSAGKQNGEAENGFEGTEEEEGHARGDTQQRGDDDNDADDRQQQQEDQEQSSGEQRYDEDMQDDAAAAAAGDGGGDDGEQEEAQEDEQQQQQRSRRSRRHRGSDDEDEERLLSSDDEDDEDA